MLNASKLDDEIKRPGYAGSQRQLRAFVHPFRVVRPSQATVRYETEPGEQAQADWGHCGYINHRGHQRRLYAFVTHAPALRCRCNVGLVTSHVCRVHGLS